MIEHGFEKASKKAMHKLIVAFNLHHSIKGYSKMTTGRLRSYLGAKYTIRDGVLYEKPPLTIDDFDWGSDDEEEAAPTPAPVAKQPPRKQTPTAAPPSKPKHQAFGDPDSMAMRRMLEAANRIETRERQEQKAQALRASPEWAKNMALLKRIRGRGGLKGGSVPRSDPVSSPPAPTPAAAALTAIDDIPMNEAAAANDRRIEESWGIVHLPQRFHRGHIAGELETWMDLHRRHPNEPSILGVIRRLVDLYQVAPPVDGYPVPPVRRAPSDDASDPMSSLGLRSGRRVRPRRH